MANPLQAIQRMDKNQRRIKTTCPFDKSLKLLHSGQPRSQVLSPTRRKTLVGSGHVSPRIWEITNKRLGGGADKYEICLYKA